MAGSLGDSCDAIYMQGLACHSCHKAEAALHLMPRAHHGGAVFALGNLGGGYHHMDHRNFWLLVYSTENIKSVRGGVYRPVSTAKGRHPICRSPSSF